MEVAFRGGGSRMSLGRVSFIPRQVIWSHHDITGYPTARDSNGDNIGLQPQSPMMHPSYRLNIDRRWGIGRFSVGAVVFTSDHFRILRLPLTLIAYCPIAFPSLHSATATSVDI